MIWVSVRIGRTYLPNDAVSSSKCSGKILSTALCTEFPDGFIVCGMVCVLRQGTLRLQRFGPLVVVSVWATAVYGR